MTIDINELRRLMQDFKLAGSPMLVQTAQMSELLDRLEAAEKSDAESIAMYRKARDERDALRTKIEQMEKQEPVVEVQWAAGIPNGILDFISTDDYLPKLGDKLYARPAPAQSVPERITHDQAPHVYSQEAAEGYADGWNACVKKIVAAAPQNGGWKLVPRPPTPTMVKAGLESSHVLNVHRVLACYDAMIDAAQCVPSVPECWLPVPEKHPTFDPVDLQLSDGSVLCGCVPQSDGDYWWEGPSGEVFIDPKYASVTHWRLTAAPEAKP